MVLWIEFSQIVNDFKIETGRRMGIELEVGRAARRGDAVFAQRKRVKGVG